MMLRKETSVMSCRANDQAPLPVALDGRRHRSLLHYWVALNHRVLGVPIARSRNAAGWLT